MTLDLVALQTLAEKATPGPWHALSTGVRYGDHWYVTDDGESIAYLSANDGDPDDLRRENAEFIAAASPDVVLSLVERVKTAEGRAERAVRAVSALCRRVETLRKDRAREKARADALEAAIQAAYNALHMESRQASVAILSAALLAAFDIREKGEG